MACQDPLSDAAVLACRSLRRPLAGEDRVDVLVDPVAVVEAVADEVRFPPHSQAFHHRPGTLVVDRGHRVDPVEPFAEEQVVDQRCRRFSDVAVSLVLSADDPSDHRFTVVEDPLHREADVSDHAAKVLHLDDESEPLRLLVDGHVDHRFPPGADTGSGPLPSDVPAAVDVAPRMLRVGEDVDDVTILESPDDRPLGLQGKLRLRLWHGAIVFATQEDA